MVKDNFSIRKKYFKYCYVSNIYGNKLDSFFELILDYLSLK